MSAPDLAQQVLDCANKVAGANLILSPDEDIALEAFHFDSLSLFAFMIELEKACAIDFDDALAHQEQLRTVRSTAQFIEHCKKSVK
jgi:acyl carrier protein